MYPRVLRTFHMQPRIPHPISFLTLVGFSNCSGVLKNIYPPPPLPPYVLRDFLTLVGFPNGFFERSLSELPTPGTPLKPGPRCERQRRVSASDIFRGPMPARIPLGSQVQHSDRNKTGKYGLINQVFHGLGHFLRVESGRVRMTLARPVRFEKLLIRTVPTRPDSTRAVIIRTPPDPTRLETRDFEGFLTRPAGRVVIRENPAVNYK